MTENDGGTPRDPQRDPETPPTQPVPASAPGAETGPVGPMDPGAGTPAEQGVPERYVQAAAEAPATQPGGPAGYGRPMTPVVSQYGYAAAPPKNDLAVWSLVTGILSYVTCPLVLGIAAIVTGTMGRRAADEGLANNRGMATAGLILGWINVALVVLGILLFIFLVGAGLLAGGLSEWSHIGVDGR